MTFYKVLAFFAIVGITSATAFAEAPRTNSAKVSRAVLERMDTQASQDVIVVYDDAAITRESGAMQAELGEASPKDAFLKMKAERFKQQKDGVASAFSGQEATILREYSHLPISFVRFHSKNALAKLIAHQAVVGVFEDRVEKTFLAESLPLIQQPQVAAQGYLGAGVSVAVLDTGVDYTRAAFGSCTAPGVGANCRVIVAQDFAVGNGQLDSFGHGTNVAGIVVGVAPGTKVLSLRVCDANGSCNVTDTIAAINFSIQYKATYNIVAMNLSLGGGKYFSPVVNDPYYSAFANARAAGILPIVASGNSTFTNAMASPGAVVGAVSVGAVYDSALGPRSWQIGCTDSSTAADKVTCFSNSASFLTLLAPGSEITAAGFTESGTSQATPHVAGAVAVLRSAYPNESLDSIVTRLTNGDSVTDPRNDLAKPRLNLAKAMAIATTCSYSVSPTTVTASAGGTNGSITVTATPGCAWQASGATAWINVTGGSVGSGNGAVTYSIAANANIASRTGILSVAGQRISISQAGASTGISNVLLNGDFEAGPIAWTQNTANGLPVLTTYLTPTGNNHWYAWFCGYDNCVDEIYQDITIPADAQTADLRFSYSIDTSEIAGSAAYDTLALQIFSPPTAASASITCALLSNLNAGPNWSTSTNCNLASYRGQTIRIRFVANTDFSNPTNFYVDDVSITVTGSALVDTQAPTTPTGLIAAAISSSQVSLSWVPSSDNVGVTAHKIYSGATFLGTVGSFPGATITNLLPATTYSFSVAACDAVGNCSAPSAAAIITTPQQLDTQSPTVPVGLAALPISTSAISLTWLASSDNVGVTSYRVFRAGTLIATLGNVLSYLDSNLRASTFYSYSVAACDAVGNCSAQSLPASAITLSPVTASTPVIFSGPSTFQTNGSAVNITIASIVNTSLTRTSGSLRLELWALNLPYAYGNGASGYKTASIRTSAISGLSDQILPNVSFNNINLNLSYIAPPVGFPNYSLFLLEYNPANCAASDGFCVIDYIDYHETQAPSVPTSLSASAISSSSIILVWQAATDNVGVTAYNVYRGGILVASLGNTTTYTDAGLAPSTAYSYSVSACDAVGNCSATSTLANATTLSQSGSSAPTIPTGLQASVINSGQVNLTWNASFDAVGVTSYKIYSGTLLVGTVGNITNSTRNTSASTTYTYSVAACNFAGNCSGQSLPVVVTTPPLASQTISFLALGNRTFGTAPFTVAATASSGLAVSFASTTQNVCTVSSVTVTIVGSGLCSLVASQQGSAAFAAASAVTQSFSVFKASQTIAFSPLVDRTLTQGGFVLAANASSTLAVVFTSQSASVCATSGVNGTTVTLLTVGACAIAANQPGDPNYLAAPQVIQTFLVIGATAPGAPIITLATPGNGQATIAFTPPTSDGGSSITGYTATCGAQQGASLTSPIVITPLTNGAAYSCSVTATNAVGTSLPSATLVVTPSASAPIALNAVKSRKNHSGYGGCEISLDISKLIGGLVSVEPRAIGNGHQIIFQFNNTVNTVSSASAVDINLQSVGSASYSISGNDVIVTLLGVPDNKRLTVSLASVNGLLTPSVAVGFLVGDINESRSVNAGDISAMKSKVGQSLTPGNCRADLNANGAITSSDISIVKARSGMMIP